MGRSGLEEIPEEEAPEEGDLVQVCPEKKPLLHT